MTIEKAQKDFMELIEKNGFIEAAKTTDTQNTVYRREWTREIEVAWQAAGYPRNSHDALRNGGAGSGKTQRPRRSEVHP